MTEATKFCKFDEAWVGICKKPLVDGDFCDKHKTQVCWCGAQATRNCDIAMSLVCGAPLCSEHGCINMGGPLTGSNPHSDKGQKQLREMALRNSTLLPLG
jgi:hypothetical protein